MVKVRNIGLVLFVSIGFALGLVLSPYLNFGMVQLENPSSLFSTDEKSSPFDRIKEHNIRLYDDKIIIYLKEPYMAKFTDTHSMEPVLDKNSNAIEVVPISSSDIKAGDIISFEKDSITIIHRVVKIGSDSEGWYAITKGDNSQAIDEGKVRFDKVKRILVGVIY